MFLAIHSALQVFRPAVTTFEVDDGIYAHRLYAYLVIFLVPIILSSLAFINKDGYISQGVFCVLPRAPSWYRLVLAWFPRFIIAILVIGLAIATYAHISRQLKDFSTSLRSSKVSTKSKITGGNPPALFPTISLPFPKREKKPGEHLSGIDEEEEKRTSSTMSFATPVRMEMRSVPAMSRQSLPPILSIPKYDQSPTARAPFTPGLVSPGAVPEIPGTARVSDGPGTAKGSDYFTSKPLVPILKAPQYSQGTELTPITPGLVSPGTTDLYRRSPIVVKDFTQADYFDAKPVMARKESFESSNGLSSDAIVPTQPWDHHGQLPQPMSNASSSACSTQSRQPTLPGSRALGRRVSIEEPFHPFAVTSPKGTRRGSLPLPDQHNQAQRNALKRSLRRVFVYPAIFVTFWIPPCAKSMLALTTNRADNDPIWLAVVSTLCLTLMGAAYCLVFLWSDHPWRHLIGTSRIWSLLCILLCLKQERPAEEEDGYPKSLSADKPSPANGKAASFVSNSTGTSTSQGEAPSQGVIQHMSKTQVPEPVAGRKGLILGQYRERRGSTTSIATTATSRVKIISFAPMGRHLGGGSTTNLAKQLALERLNLEQLDRRNNINFQRRSSMNSRPSGMSSKASVVTSLGSITEVTRREWWDEVEAEIEEAEHSDDDFEEEEG